jgi:DNA-binding Xre family transcriptional regulator
MWRRVGTGLYPNTAPLRDTVRALMDARGLINAGALANASRGGLSRQVADRFLTGQTRALQRRTLEAVADALGARVEDLIRLTGHPVGCGPWVWPSEFDDVPEPVRRGVQRAVAAMLRASGVLPDPDTPPAD